MNQPYSAIRTLGRGKSLLRLVTTIAATSWLWVSSSCLLVTNRDKDQCAKTADCVSKGARFAGTQCVQGVCVTTDAGVGICSTNADCLSNPETPDTYCSAGNECLPIIDSNCGTILTVDGQHLTPDAIVLGVLAPLSGAYAPYGQAPVSALQLALAEFSERAIGIPAGPGTAPRPIALVVCDQVIDVEGAAAHLVGHVRVPAILGPAFSGTTVKVAMNVTIPNGVLLIAPSATTPDLTTLQDNGLVWRTSSSFAPEAQAFAGLVTQMETNSTVRESLGLESTAPIKIAILAKGDSYGKGLADLLTAALQFNGKSAASNGTSYFARFDLPDLIANPQADTQTVVSGIVQTFKPHLVLAVGAAEVITNGLEAIEEQWITGTGAQARPHYIFSEGARLGELVTAVGTSESLHPDRALKDRIRVFSPRYNDALCGLLQSRYSAANGNQPLPNAYGITETYDAFYLIAYALSANQTLQPTGATIAEGLKRTVPPGMVIAAGPSDVSKAVAELGAGRNIDYDGTTGKLDFDLTTGEWPGDYDLYCVQPTQFQRTGQYYISAETRWVGEYAAYP